MDSAKSKPKSRVIAQKEKFNRNVMGKIHKNIHKSTQNTALEKNLDNLDIPNKNRIHTRLLDECKEENGGIGVLFVTRKEKIYKLDKKARAKELLSLARKHKHACAHHDDDHGGHSGVSPIQKGNVKENQKLLGLKSKK